VTTAIEGALLQAVVRDPANVCPHVADGAPILLAAREEGEGTAACEWRFRCGAEADDAAGVRVMPLDEIVRRDPAAIEIVLHPRGTTLERASATARWHTGAGPVLLPHRPSRRWPRFEPVYPPRRGEPLDAADLRLLADVAQAGFHVASSPTDALGPAFAFSVGLFRNFDHPEIATFGLAVDVVAAAVGRMCELVRTGTRLEEGDIREGILDDRAVAFRRIVPHHYPAHLGHAVWYHGGARFPALQAVWSDAGHFPWERWFSRELRDAQPVLFEPEPA
jgi:hypothetical protein